MSHYGVGVLLLTAVAGYWVLERAETHKGRLKRVGQLLGGFIIIVSLAGAVCRVWCLAMGKMDYCPVNKTGKGYYPFRSNAPSNPSPLQ